MVSPLFFLQSMDHFDRKEAFMTLRQARSATAKAAAGALALSLSLMQAGVSLAASIDVEVNQTKPFKLPRAAETIIVGNPAVANVTVDSHERVFILGRTYGRTNMIAVDPAGEIILDMDVNVVNAGGIVTLNAGRAQRSFNCTPRCERVLDPNDAQEEFDAQMKNTTAHTGYIDSVANGGAPPAGGN